MKLNWFILVIALVMSSCSKSKPELSDSELKFADILTEIYLVNGISNQIQVGNKDSLRTQLTMQVLKAHDMDTTEFYKKLYRMEKDPAKFKITYDTVVARMEKMKAKI